MTANAATTRKPALGIIYTSKLFHFPWCRRGNKFNKAAISGAGVPAADLETETDSREVAPPEKLKHTASAQAVSQVRGLPSLGVHLLTVSNEISSGKEQKATERSQLQGRPAFHAHGTDFWGWWAVTLQRWRACSQLWFGDSDWLSETLHAWTPP